MIEIRTPVSADAQALGRMHHAAWREAYGALLPEAFWDGFGVEGRIGIWERMLAEPAPGSRIALADADGAPVGFAAAGAPGAWRDSGHPPVRDTELWLLYLLESQHGSGLAARLLDSVLDPGVPAQLWVFEHNPRARAFYAKHGFVPDGARHDFGPAMNDESEIRLVR